MFFRLGGRAHFRGVWLPSWNCEGWFGIWTISVKIDLRIAFRPLRREWSRLLMLFTFYNQTIRQLYFVLCTCKKRKAVFCFTLFFFCKQCNVHLSKSHSIPPKIWNPQSILWFGTWHYEQQQSWPGKKLSCCCCTCCRGCCGRCYRSSSFSSCCCYCRRIFRSSCCLGEN